MKKIFILIAIIFGAITLETSAQSFQLIVNNSNVTNSLSKKEVSDIFLKKKVKWENGTAVVPVDLNANSSTREDFSQSVHEKKVSAIRSYWQQAIFSGAGTAPIEKSSDEEVLSYVRSNPGAVGYISAGANASGVKTIKIN